MRREELPEKMTAIAITEPGGPMVLKPERRDLPELREGEILIRVRAAGVNRPDVAQRAGAYPPPPGASDLPGLEVAGEGQVDHAARDALHDRVSARARVDDGAVGQDLAAHEGRFPQ